MIVVCLVPRVIGLAINREANDDHLPVVQLWLEKGHFPGYRDCWECFQPPLYYSLIYVPARLAGTHDRETLLRIAHAWNFVFCAVILVLLSLQISRFAIPTRRQYLLFMFVGLNPKLIAINIQATNDTLVIMLGMIVLLFLMECFDSFSWTTLAIIWLGALLAATAKGNGLVILAGVMGYACLCVAMQRGVPRWDRAVTLILFVISLPSAAALLGGYWSRYEQSGDPFVINQQKAKPPPLFTFDNYQGKRMGVRSIADCFLTFRLLDLIRNPSLKGERETYREHRTSFWTQLYGQALHAQFEHWPRSWVTDRKEVGWLARCLYILGLVPIGLLIHGYWLQAGLCRTWLRRGNFQEALKASIPLAFAAAFLVFLAKYVIDYRDFSTMKFVFILPALPALVSLLGIAIGELGQSTHAKACLVVLAALCMGSVINVSFLLITLFQNTFT